MKKKMLFLLCLAVAWSLAVSAQPSSDPRCIALEGIPIQGPIDTLRQQLLHHDYAEWGQSDDGEDYYFRGKYYGFRAKLMVSIDTVSRLVASAYVTIGPYSTPQMLHKNLEYFLYKLTKAHGDFVNRDDSWYYTDDYGSVKLSIVDNPNGSRDLRILYLPLAPYYKDLFTMGFHGPVQEVVTENAVAEDQFLHFRQDGQIDNPDLQDRHYDRHGYLLSARMQEKEGVSLVTYDYDDRYRLVRRTLKNDAAGISYINDYTYNDRGEPLTNNQKVFDRSGDCVLTINMQNGYITRDEQGNWTTNSLTLNYWEKDSKTQQVTVLQRRTLTYWE